MIIKKTLAYALALLVFAGITAATIAVLYPGMIFGAQVTYAGECYTAAATTTETRITNGGATSTIDCYIGDGGAIGTLYTIFHASGTAVVLNIDFEFSNDNINWFKDNFSDTATSSLGIGNSIAWTFASDTPSQLGVGATPVCFAGAINENDCAKKAINVPTQTQYVRVIYTATGGTATIWGRLVPKVDIN